MDSALLNYVKENNIEYYINKKTSDIVSFKIGGCADLIVYPGTIYELCEILLRIKSRKKKLVGFGTNCYFCDRDYLGTVVVTRRIDGAYAYGNRIFASCGASLTSLCKLAQENSCEGLEFAYGIPGSLGGAVAMNASAFGGEMSKIVYSSIVFDAVKEEIKVLSHSKHEFGVKSSVFKNQEIYLLKSELILKKGCKTDILQRMNNNFKKRVETQPLDFPSAGSTFVRPPFGYASKMIDMCGLKGLQVGGAMVSNKHAGFIVNIGGATAEDVSDLTKIIKEKVFEKFGVELKEEIIYIE